MICRSTSHSAEYYRPVLRAYSMYLLAMYFLLRCSIAS
jgi:hypothetical protein